MYALDINFLNDRPDLKPDKGKAPRRPRLSAESQQPLLIGAVMLVCLPTLALGLWGVFAYRNGDLDRQQASLDTQLGSLEVERKKLETVNTEIKQTSEESQALATVFNQIKPWSAMSQDIRDRLPASIQLTAIKQIEAPKPSAAQGSTASSTGSPSATPVSPPVSGLIQLEGLANSFADVNDFLLTLQQSNFLKTEQTKLITSELAEQKTLQMPSFSNEDGQKVSVKPPKLPRQVKFSLVTALNEVPASELIRELDRKGAVGLVARIEALKARGVISMPNGTPVGSSTPQAKTNQAGTSPTNTSPTNTSQLNTGQANAGKDGKPSTGGTKP